MISVKIYLYRSISSHRFTAAYRQFPRCYNPNSVYFDCIIILYAIQQEST